MSSPMVAVISLVVTLAIVGGFGAVITPVGTGNGPVAAGSGALANIPKYQGGLCTGFVVFGTGLSS